MNFTKQNSYILRVLVGLSILICALFGGQMYEPVCAAAWRLRKEKGIKGLWAHTSVWLMDILEPGHCYKAWLWFQKVIGLGPELDPLPKYGGCLMTMDTWISSVECGAFIDYDGYGYYSDGKRMTDSVNVRPSMINKGEVDRSWSHIMWFNR